MEGLENLGGRRFWDRWKFGHKRLASSLPPYRLELEHLIEQGTQKADSSGSKLALQLLDAAEHALKEGDAEGGWRCFNAALSAKVLVLAELEEQSALKAEAQTLWHEANEKLSSWRKTAVLELLEELRLKEEESLEEVGAGKKNADNSGSYVYFEARHKLYRASQLLYEHFNNDYYKRYALLKQLRSLGLLVSIVVLLSILFWIIYPPPSAPNTPVFPPEFIVLVAIFGLLGASFSGILSLTRESIATVCIPQQIVNGWITLARMAIGVVAAIATYVFLTSKIFTIGELSITPPLVLGAAFIVGFTERLVTRVVEAVSR